MRLMVDLAEHHSEEYVSLRDVADRQDISMKYLEQIVGALARGSMLQSSRGPKGGYRLYKPFRDYTMKAILESVEGSLAPVSCAEFGECERGDACPIQPYWQGLHNAMSNYLEGVTLEEIVLNHQNQGSQQEYSGLSQLTGNW